MDLQILKATGEHEGKKNKEKDAEDLQMSGKKPMQ